MLAEVVSASPLDVIVAAIGGVVAIVTAWFAWRSASHAKAAQEEVRSGNGKPTGSYIIDIDQKLDRILVNQGRFDERMDQHEENDRQAFAALYAMVREK